MTACSYNRSSLQAFAPVGIRRQKIDQCSDSSKVLERQTIILNVIFFQESDLPNYGPSNILTCARLAYTHLVTENWGIFE